jgi:hypothetical protein
VPVAGSALSRDHVEQQPGVAVGGVGDEHVDPGLDERGRPLPGVAEVADGGADEQAAVGVLAGIGELLALDEVLDGDEAGEAPSSSTSGSRSRLCWRSRAVASSREMPTGAVMSGIGVITSRPWSSPTPRPG